MTLVYHLSNNKLDKNLNSLSRLLNIFKVWKNLNLMTDRQQQQPTNNGAKKAICFYYQYLRFQLMMRDESSKFYYK